MYSCKRATVITNLFSAIPWIGNDLVQLIWGGFSIDEPTLNRFFSIHYLLPFILAALVCMHLLALHVDASNNPEGISSKTDQIRFHPYFTSKDLITFFLFGIIISFFVFFDPNYLGHADNSIVANPLVTPPHIQPEWYFLPYYAILRSIPNKLLGVIAMFASLLILIPLCLINSINIRSNKYRPVMQILFWIFVFNFFLLMWLGAKPIEEPYVLVSQISTIIYFSYFIILMILGCTFTFPSKSHVKLLLRRQEQIGWVVLKILHGEIKFVLIQIKSIDGLCVITHIRCRRELYTTH